MDRDFLRVPSHSRFSAPEPLAPSAPAGSSKKIAIVNQKGGCGKTTTAINLAGCLACEGYRVLLMDCDPQAQASLGLGVDIDTQDKTLYDVLMGRAGLEAVVKPTTVGGLDIASSNHLLAGAQLELASVLGRESVLKGSLKKFLDIQSYDYCLADCSPTLNLVTVNALVACDYIFIPFQTHYFSLEGMRELLSTIETVRERLNPDLKILGILPTLFDGRMKMNHEILKQIKDHFQELVFETCIHINVKLCEAPLYKKPIHLYAPESKGTRDYGQATKEVIARTQQIPLESLLACGKVPCEHA